MKVASPPARIAIALILAALLPGIAASAADDPVAPDAAAAEAAPAPAPPPAKVIDVKKMFAMNCSWCHDGYGMHAGKGPKLAGTSMTPEQVYLRIAKGKSGMMPGFEKTLSKEQIAAFVASIKSLKDPDS